MIRKIYEAKIEEIEHPSGVRTIKIAFGREIQGEMPAQPAAPPKQPYRPPVQPAQEPQGAALEAQPEHVPLPPKYWGLKKQGKLEEASKLIGGPMFYPKKLEDNSWVIMKRQGNQLPFESYKYVYQIPFPAPEFSSARERLKNNGGRFRSDKMPDGDNCWYSNDLIPELRQFIINGERQGVKPILKEDRAEDTFDEFGEEDIPF